MKKVRVSILALLLCGASSAHALLVHEFTKNGNIAWLKSYVAAGKDINARNNLRRTSLVYACGYGQYDVFEYLVSLENIEIDALDESGRTPLHYAVSIDDLSYQDVCEKMARELIKKGAKINIQDVDGFAPLHLAVLQKQTKAIKVLLENKVDKSLVTSEGYTALALAKIMESSEIISLLS